MKKIIYTFLSFLFVFSFSFSSFAAKELSLGCFEGYAEQEWIDEFEAKYDAKVKVKYVGSVDELFALTQASKGEDFDLISIDTSLFPRYEFRCANIWYTGVFKSFIWSRAVGKAVENSF